MGFLNPQISFSQLVFEDDLSLYWLYLVVGFLVLFLLRFVYPCIGDRAFPRINLITFYTSLGFSVIFALTNRLTAIFGHFFSTPSSLSTFLTQMVGFVLLIHYFSSTLNERSDSSKGIFSYSAIFSRILPRYALYVCLLWIFALFMSLSGLWKEFLWLAGFLGQGLFINEHFWVYHIYGYREKSDFSLRITAIFSFVLNFVGRFAVGMITFLLWFWLHRNWYESMTGPLLLSSASFFIIAIDFGFQGYKRLVQRNKRKLLSA